MEMVFNQFMCIFKWSSGLSLITSIWFDTDLEFFLPEVIFPLLFMMLFVMRVFIFQYNLYVLPRITRTIIEGVIKEIPAFHH